MQQIKASIQKILTEIANSKNPNAQILAVSKKQPIEKIIAAYDAGIRDFGENYVQELVEKRQQLTNLNDIRWHLIGPLQVNKVKQALENADFFHALDSEKLLKEIAKRSAQIKRKSPWSIFVQVNIDDESTKSGVSPEMVSTLIEFIEAEPTVKLQGLMCIPKPSEDLNESRLSFQKLVALRNSISPSLQLSMGMSHDYSVALDEGSNWIRLGTKIFGAR